MNDLDPVEVRVLGCLVEKQRTTPDAYPLSLNALRLACNQSTNRDPVVHYDEPEIREALHRLSQRRFSRLASGHSSRAHKFRHLLDEALALDGGEISVLTVLMLRGAQTPGELKARTERLQRFDDLAAVHEVLERLSEREYVLRLERRPGQKEERYRHTLSDDAPGGPPPVEERAAAPAPRPLAPPAPAEAPAPVDDGRLDRLETEVRELRAEVARLRDALGDTGPE